MRNNVVKSAAFLLVLPVATMFFLLIDQPQMAMYSVYLYPVWGLMVLVNFIRTNGFV